MYTNCMASALAFAGAEFLAEAYNCGIHKIHPTGILAFAFLGAVLGGLPYLTRTRNARPIDTPNGWLLRLVAFALLFGVAGWMTKGTAGAIFFGLAGIAPAAANFALVKRS